MGMVVRTNTMALNAYRQLGMNNNSVAKSLEKLSSGFRINRAGDDAAGLAISEKMKAQITGLETASSNAQDGISLIQTAEGALTEVHSMLNRMVELATKSANGTYQNEVDREAIQAEVDALNEEIDRISQSTNFNGINLLDGSTGLNADAFSIGGAEEGKAGDPIKLESAFPTEGAINSTGAPNTAIHVSKKGNDQENPSFAFDLGKMELTATDSTSSANVVDFNIAGVTVSVTLEVGKKYDANAIAKKIAESFNTETLADGKGNFLTQGTSGDMYFTAKADGSSVIFEYAGFNATTADASVEDKFSQSEADTVNALLKGPGDVDGADTNQVINAPFVSVTATNGGSITGWSSFHSALKVNWAKAESTQVPAGIDFNLAGSGVIGDGNKLTIDGKTFVFKTDSESNLNVKDNEILIDVSEYASATQQAAAAVAKLSNYETDNFLIEAVDGSKIHIDQKVGSENMYTKYEDLTGLFSAQKKGTDPGTKLTVNVSKLANGNTIKVGNDTYKFVKEATGAKNEIAISDNAEDTLKALESAIEKNGYTVDRDNGSNVLTVRGSKSPAITGGGITLQIGDTGNSFNMMTVAVDDMSTTGLGVKGLNVLNADSARSAIDTIKTAINKVSTNRANMGALQNRLEHTINNLDVAVENLNSANSRIRDTDMAKEMMNYTKMNVLVQSAQAMLAQANQQPQSVLQLLQ